jgi:hypothetical protein
MWMRRISVENVIRFVMERLLSGWPVVLALPSYLGRPLDPQRRRRDPDPDPRHRNP